MNENPTILRRLEHELRNIRKRIDNEQNPTRKAKMINVYSKMTVALTGKEL